MKPMKAPRISWMPFSRLKIWTNQSEMKCAAITQRDEHTSKHTSALIQHKRLCLCNQEIGKCNRRVDQFRNCFHNRSFGVHNSFARFCSWMHNLTQLVHKLRVHACYECVLSGALLLHCSVRTDSIPSGGAAFDSVNKGHSLQIYPGYICSLQSYAFKIRRKIKWRS